MNQTELQRLYDLAKIAGERPLIQLERLALAQLAKQAVEQVIGQSKRIAELKSAPKVSAKHDLKVPEFLAGLFGVNR